MLRNALLPALWIAAWISSDFEWRGNAMTIADQAGRRDRHRTERFVGQAGETA
jgi:ceramide glucosyltransferase